MGTYAQALHLVLVNQAASSLHDQPLTLVNGLKATDPCIARQEKHREAPNLVRARAVQMQGVLGAERAVSCVGQETRAAQTYASQQIDVESESLTDIAAGADEVFVQVGAGENVTHPESDDGAHGVWCVVYESTKLGQAAHMALHALAGVSRIDQCANVKFLENQLMNLQRETGEETAEVICALEHFTWRQFEDFDADAVDEEIWSKNHAVWIIANYHRTRRTERFHVDCRKRSPSMRCRGDWKTRIASFAKLRGESGSRTRNGPPLTKWEGKLGVARMGKAPDQKSGKKGSPFYLGQ